MPTISIRLEKETKDKFSTFCDQVGIPISTALTLFIKTVIRENKIPFEIKGEELKSEGLKKQDDGFYSEANIKYLEEQVRLYNEGKLKFEVHKSLDELRKMEK